MTFTPPEWLGRSQPELVRDYLEPPAAPRAAHLSVVLDRCEAKHGVVEIKRNGVCEAVAGVEKLAWDSAHFGIGCARLAPVCIAPDVAPADRLAAVSQVLDFAFDWCRSQQIAVLQRRVVGARADEVRVLEDRGLRLMDSIVTFTTPSAAQRPEPFVRGSRPGDADALLSIARDAFPYSRFLADPSFDPAKAREVYVRWLETLLSGAASGNKSGEGGTVLIAEVGGRATGFLSIRRDRDLDALTGQTVAPIEMIAIGADQRGMGLGGALLKAARNWAAEHGATLVEASTWTAAADIRRFYAGAGFAMRDVLFTFHGRVA